MTSLATNARNDLYLDATSGNLAMARGIVAVEQEAEHAMKAQLGECVLALDRGVPTDATIWTRWNPVQFEAYARKMILSVQNVLAVQSFNITRSGDVASYVAVIATTFGNVTISGIIGNG